MNSNSNGSTKKLLRSAYPGLYDHLIEELSAHNIHSFDIQATCSDVDTGVEIQVLFGEDFTIKHSQLFSKDNMNTIDNEFSNFCEELAEACKKTLIADYFKMVKP